MHPPILLLRTHGSDFLDRLDESLGGRARIVHGSLESGELGPLTVADGDVTSNGVSWSDAGAIFVDRAPFSWPQPDRALRVASHGSELRGEAAREREELALLGSALRVAARACPVVNPPTTFLWTSSPSAALARLEREGVPTAAWHLGAQDDRRLKRAALERPGLAHAIPSIEPFEGPVSGVVCVGSEAPLALTWPDGGVWASDAAPRLSEAPEDAARIALRAAEVLGTPLCTVHVAPAESGPCVAAVEASPDWDAWDARLDGRLVPAVAAYLTHLTTTNEGQ